MNKAEKAAFEALRVRAALSWPAPPPPPIPLSEIDHGEPFYAWWVIPSRGVGGAVGLGVVDGRNHSTTPYTRDQLTNRYSGNSRVSLSQGMGGPWYRSEADALAAYHWITASQAAELLADIERRIADFREAEAAKNGARRDLGVA